VGRLLLPLVALAVLVGAPGSVAAPPQKHYSRLYVQASFTYALDYGSHPDAVFNGTFMKDILYSARAIVVYDGSSASLLPGAGVVVQGDVSLRDDLTQGFTVVENHEAKVVRKPHVCKGPGAHPNVPEFFSSQTGSGSSSVYVFTKGGSFSISNTGLSFDPGKALTDVGCVATESLPAHGLRSGPTFTVSPPPRSRFAGTTAFSIHCGDSFKHDFIKETGGNGHAFKGSVKVSVTFTPFPAANLAATKQRLRDSVGQQDPSAPTGTNDCIR
jgi:hypothetical protein